MTLTKFIVNFKHDVTVGHLLRRVNGGSLMDTDNDASFRASSLQLKTKGKVYEMIDYLRAYAKYRANAVVSIEFLSDDDVEASD